MAGVDVSGYNDVASRMREFFEKYPDGTLKPAAPWRIERIGEQTFIVFEAAAHRNENDKNPGIGTAWEPFPGRTPYTRDSELMNAETSAWGRAILAIGAADTRKGIASAEEVRNRAADEEHRSGQRRAAPPVKRPEDYTDTDIAEQHEKLYTLPIGNAVSGYDWMASQGLITRDIPALDPSRDVRLTATQVLAERMAEDALHESATVNDIALIRAFAEDRGLLKVQVSESETLDQALTTARELAQHAADQGS